MKTTNITFQKCKANLTIYRKITTFTNKSNKSKEQEDKTIPSTSQ